MMGVKIIMAKTCVFCGKEISTFNSRKLYCGDYGVNLCPSCYEQYEGMDTLEFAEELLATGRSKHDDYYRDFIENEKRSRQAALEREKRAEEAYNSRHPEVGRCPKCSGPMLQYHPIQVKLGEETIIFDKLNRLMSGSLTVQMNRCRECGYTEFYTPEETELPK